METKLEKQIHFPQKSVLLRYFQQYISRTIHTDKNSNVTVYDIQRLTRDGKSLPNQSYLLELISEWVDGSYEFKKLVVKHLGSNIGFYPNIKLHLKHFFKIRSVRIPKFIHIDLESGYVFREFISGTNVANILRQIILQKRIKNWQKRLLEKIGQGLAEIHLKLKMIHGDPRIVNWICEEGREKIFLIDWEWAGKGDPAWDLSRLIYDVGREVSQLIYELGLDTEDGIFDLCDTIFSTITTGYAKSYDDREIIRQSAGYWIHHAFSVIPKIQEKIFQHCRIPLPRGFRFLRYLPPPIFSTAIMKKQSIAKRFMKAYARIFSIFLLLRGKRNRKHGSGEFKKLALMFAREMRR